MNAKLNLFVSVCLFFAISSSASSDEPLGISKTKPISGQYVKIANGYMVPYKAKIPGTDVEYEMVPVPGGEYWMGSPDSEKQRDKIEGPQVKVKVDPFWIGKYEVTWKEYMAYMDLDDIFKQFEANKLRPVDPTNKVDAITAPSGLYVPDHTYDKGDDPDQPAVTMTQFAARQYTKWLSITSDRFYRIPTAAEWEYACRAGTKTAYYFGNDPTKLGKYAWYSKNAKDLRQKVGLKKPNGWGLYDMHGNAAEWVIDSNAEDGYSQWKDKTIHAASDIRWPKSLDGQIIRGGSFEMDAKDCRSASILLTDTEEWKSEDPNGPKSPWWFTTEPATGVGMRVVRPLNPPSTRKAKEKFWGQDVEESWLNAESRIEFNGRGSFGLVDKDLPQAIVELKKLMKEKKKNKSKENKSPKK